MDKSMSDLMPRARSEQLLLHDLADELLVYDLKRHKAHSLNKTAAFVWNRCDGKTSVTEIAQLLKQDLGTPVDESVVWLAVKQFDKARLLGEAPPRPAVNAHLSRREVMRRLGWSAAALPLVVTILAPTAAQAQSAPCRARDVACTLNSQCCSGNCRGNNLCA